MARAFAVAVTDIGGRSVCDFETGVVDGEKVRKLFETFASAIESGQIRDTQEGTFVVASLYRVHFVLCQRVWIVACAPATASTWCTSRVVGNCFDLLVAACENKVTLKRLEKQFVDIHLGLMKILLTGRDGMDIVKPSISQQLHESLTPTTAKAVSPHTATTSSPPHTDTFNSPALDEYKRSWVWNSHLQGVIQQSLERKNIFQQEREYSLAVSKSFPYLEEVARVAQTMSGKKASKKKKELRKSMKSIEQQIRERVFDDDFGEVFECPSLQADTDDLCKTGNAPQQFNQQVLIQRQPGGTSEAIATNDNQTRAEEEEEEDFFAEMAFESAVSLETESAESRTHNHMIDQQVQDPFTSDPFSEVFDLEGEEQAEKLVENHESELNVSISSETSVGSGAQGESYRVPPMPGFEVSPALPFSISEAFQPTTLAASLSVRIQEQCIFQQKSVSDQTLVTAMARGKLYTCSSSSTSSLESEAVVELELTNQETAPGVKVNPTFGTLHEDKVIRVKPTALVTVEPVNVALYWMAPSWKPSANTASLLVSLRCDSESQSLSVVCQPQIFSKDAWTIVSADLQVDVSDLSKLGELESFQVSQGGEYKDGSLRWQIDEEQPLQVFEERHFEAKFYPKDSGALGSCVELSLRNGSFRAELSRQVPRSFAVQVDWHSLKDVPLVGTAVVELLVKN